MAQISRWQRFVDAAVKPDAPSARPEGLPTARPTAPRQATAGNGSAFIPQMAGSLRDRLAGLLASDPVGIEGAERPRRRMDLRLVPTALLVWGAAVAGVWLPLLALTAIFAGFLLGACLLLLAVRRRRARVGPGCPAPRSLLTTLNIALALAAVAASHSAVTASQRQDGAVADAVASRSAVVVEAEVSGIPRRLKMPGGSGTADRWSVPVTAFVVIANGGEIQADAELLVMGGRDWEHLVPGQRIRTTGKLKPPDPGQAEAGILSATTAPVITVAAEAWQEGPGALRSRFASAAEWISGDARGLLPGMVTGDTSFLDEQLESAMKTVGMTHLTAVSGANCSLILGALLLAARSLRLPRAPAAVFALAGLALFVLMVGPDASVLRAALMGAIGLAALSGGRTGRGLSFLCLAVIGLLLTDPTLGTSFSFLLSVLATLGIVVIGQRIVGWLPHAVPRWLAAGLAVPLSAQLSCGPVIVLLQPQFSSYALLANVVAAPLVAPVTILGTAAVPLVPLVPWAAVVPMGIAAASAGGVAAISRFFAALPGAALPWPEGLFGAATMVLLSAITLLALWLSVRPKAALLLVRATHGRTAEYLDRFLPSAVGHSRGRGGRRRDIADWPRDVPRGTRGLEVRLRRDSLRGNNPISGRNQEWPLRRHPDPGRRRLIQRRGGM